MLELLAHLVGAGARVHLGADHRSEGGVLEESGHRRVCALVDQLRVTKDELGDSVPVVVSRHRNEPKNARTSSTRSSGSSMAAKWPPAGISVQWVTL